MNKILSIFIASIIVSLFSINVLASHMVHGYYRSNGTYVAPHMSMNPGESKSTGYSYHNNQLVPNNSPSSSKSSYSTYNYNSNSYSSGLG